MREINLREYEKSEGHPLSVDERDALREAIPSVTVEPAAGEKEAYHLTPSSTVGAVEVGDLSVLIRPKIGVPKLLSLACYAMGVFKSQERLFDFSEEETLPDTLALALAAAAQRAFARGLLHGYRTEAEALLTVRGRIRFDEQIRRRFGIPLPVEVQYDEFTDDILANQLVKAAAHRLGRMRLRSPEAQRRIGWISGIQDNVSLVPFAPNDVPEVKFDRLNEHYRSVVALSRLILRHGAYEADWGEMRASGFLMDMNKVFQEFVTVSLRETLGLNERTFRESYIRSLDEEGCVNLKPDLTWWDGFDCTFVGDAKYKRIKNNQQVPNADLYQLLAYVTALDLPGGMLIYAEGETESVVHKIRHSGKRIEVAALDLSGSLDEILARVRCLAKRVQILRNEACGLRRAA